MTARTWTSRVIFVLTVLFLVFDAATKIVPSPQVVDAFAKLHLPIHLAPVIGSILTVALAVYLIPRTRVLGAVLLTGYLGGAVAVNLLAGNPVFQTVFPVLFGILVWAPPYLTDERVRRILTSTR